MVTASIDSVRTDSALRLVIRRRCSTTTTTTGIVSVGLPSRDRPSNLNPKVREPMSMQQHLQGIRQKILGAPKAASYGLISDVENAIALCEIGFGIETTDNPVEAHLLWNGERVGRVVMKWEQQVDHRHSIDFTICGRWVEDENDNVILNASIASASADHEGGSR